MQWQPLPSTDDLDFQFDLQRTKNHRPTPLIEFSTCKFRKADYVCETEQIIFQI